MAHFLLFDDLTRFTPRHMRTIFAFLPLLLLLCHAGTALGSASATAGLKVMVTDAQGAPLQDAVVMLESAHGRLPVKPMPQMEVAQSKREFYPHLTVITVGTPVNFPNFDTVRHQVYSFSPLKSFELKLYAGVPTAPIVFDKPGVAALGCNIHDQMGAWIVVVDTPHFGRTSALGEVHLESVAPGAYRLRAWHAGVLAGNEPAPQSITVGVSDMTARIQLPVDRP